MRREHHHGHPVGTTGYGYGFLTFGNGVDEYGNGRFQNRIFKIIPKNPGKLKEGDVVGLMITLPDLRIHQKVAEGTFDQAVDAPGLECGPYVPKKAKAAAKSGAKKGKAKVGTKVGTTEASTLGTSTAQDQGNTPQLPAVVDIIRDRIPFEHKGKGSQVIYFESPEYTVNRDIETGTSGKGKSINPETNTVYDLTEDTYPNHALAAAFAADLRRYLNQEPVEAHAPGVWYRLRKAARRRRAALAIGAAVAALAAIPWFLASPGRTPPTARWSLLTSYPGYELQPALSPDGKRRAFAWDAEKGNYDIYVQDVGTPSPTRLTTDPAFDQHPSWSPDGRCIAFLRISDKRGQPDHRPAPAVRLGWGRHQLRGHRLHGDSTPNRLAPPTSRGSQFPPR